MIKKIWLILSIIIFAPATVLVTNGILTKTQSQNSFKKVWDFIVTTRPEPAGYYTHIMVDLTANVASRLSSPWDNCWKENLGFEDIMQNIHDDLCRIAYQRIFIDKEDLTKRKLMTEKTLHWVQKFSEVPYHPSIKEVKLKNLQKNLLN